MSRFSFVAGLLVAFLTGSLGLHGQDTSETKDLLLTGGRILDVEHGTLVEAQVLVTGQRIRAVGPALKFEATNTAVIELDGMVIIPGMIDLRIRTFCCIRTTKRHGMIRY